jgi:hypothetical protein
MAVGKILKPKQFQYLQHRGSCVFVCQADEFRPFDCNSLRAVSIACYEGEIAVLLTRSNRRR